MGNIENSTIKKRQFGSKSKYGDSFKRMVVQHYLEGNESMSAIAQRFGVNKIDVSNWKKRFESELALEPKVIPMTLEEQKQVEVLQKQLENLSKKLDYERMKNFALETMIDLAKTELGIDIRKNSGAKQPKE